LYLSAAGVGTLGIVDMDVVDPSNVQHQSLHNVDRIGDRKIESARKTLIALTMSSDVNIVTHDVRLDASSILDIISGYAHHIVSKDTACRRSVETVATVDRAKDEA
jgi:molybdopterin/thiamine biosynthesis adenylyltransferase